jgi:hypothetical protein
VFLHRLDVSTWLLGGALLFYGRGTVLLLIPLLGYLRRIIEFAPSDDEVPTFDDWSMLIADGTRLLVVLLVYFVTLPLLAILIIERGLLNENIVQEFFPLLGTVTLALLTGAAEGTLVSTESQGPLIDTVVVGQTSYSLTSVEPVVLFVVLSYAYPAAAVQVIDKQSIWAAFRYRSLKPQLTSPGYVARWGVFTSLSLLALGLLFEAGDLSLIAERTVGEASGRSFILTNEAGELVVFVVSVLSFRILVLAHFVLGKNELPASWSRLLTFVNQRDRAITVVALGGVLLSLGIFPSLVLVVGYLSKVLDHELKGASGYPPFRPWMSLVRRGLPLTAVWIALNSIAWSVLLLGQGREELINETGLMADAGANAVIGITGLPVGSPISYQFDRLVGDILWGLGIPVRTVPYAVGDPGRIAPVVGAGFLLTLLLTWVAFTLIVAADRTRQFTGDSLVYAVFRLGRFAVSSRPSGYWSSLGRVALWWIFGGMPLVGWYVWRRHVDSTGEILGVVFDPIGVEVASPSSLSVLSILFLFSASVVNFYSLSRAYRCLGSTVRRMVLE